MKTDSGGGYIGQGCNCNNDGEKSSKTVMKVNVMMYNNDDGAMLHHGNRGQHGRQNQFYSVLLVLIRSHGNNTMGITVMAMMMEEDQHLA